MADFQCPDCGGGSFEVTIALSGGSSQVKMTCKGCGRLFSGDSDALKRQLGGGGSQATGTPSPSGGQMESEGRQVMEQVKLTDLPDIPEMPADQTYGPLLEAATAEVYRRNAFRIIGLGVEASAREISKQVEKLKMAARLGAGATLSEDDLRDAVQRLQDPERRLVEEIFWFWPLKSGESDAGLEAAARGDWPAADAAWRHAQAEAKAQRSALVESAEAEWARARAEGAGGLLGAHNLAVLRHWQALEFEEAARSRDLTPAESERRATLRAEALWEWQETLEEEAFWARLQARCRALDDPRLDGAALGRLRASLPQALLGIEARLAVEAAGRGMATEARKIENGMLQAGFLRDRVDEALRRALRPIRERIRKLVDTVGVEADRDPPGAKRVADGLLKDAKPLLVVLDILQAAGETLRDGAHDEVALGLLNAQIAYGNKTEDWTESIRLLDQALPLAASDSARQRITRNLEILRKNQAFDQCWWCGTGKAESGKALMKAFHRDVQRIPTGYNQVRVTWRQSEISVPRCPDCANIHGRAKVIGGVVGAVSGILVVIPLMALNASCPGGPGGPSGGKETGCGCIVSLAVSVGAGVGMYHLMLKLLSGKIRDEAWADEFPAVKEKITGGWSVGKEPATQ